MNKFNIQFVTSLPSRLIPNSFYIVNTDTTPKFYVTSNLGVPKLINPATDLSELVHTVNKLSPTSGDITLSIEFNSKTGELNLTGSEDKVNLNEVFYNKEELNKELAKLNKLILNKDSSSGLKLPVDVSLQSEIPTEDAGTVLRIINNKKINNTDYHIGDILIYYNSSNPPIHLKTTNSGTYLGVFNNFSDLPRNPELNNTASVLNEGDYYYDGSSWKLKNVKSSGTFLGVKSEFPSVASLYDIVMVNNVMYYYDNTQWTKILDPTTKVNIDGSNLNPDNVDTWLSYLGLVDLVTGDEL